MTLSDLSIKKPVFAWMLMVGLIVFGWIGFSRMGVSLLPDVDFPVISVSVTLEGAAPNVMETEVADVLEDAVMGVQGVREVTSVSRLGQTSLSVEFELNRNIDVALQDVQAKIAQAQKTLPEDVDPPIITKSNPEDQPILWIALSFAQAGEAGSLRDLMAYTHDTLKDQFTTIAGVGDVNLGGYIEPNLRVWLNNQSLNENDLTVSDITQAIRTEHQESPAGTIDTGQQEMNVRVLGEASSVDEFSKIIIPQRSGAPIWGTFRLGDVAKIEDDLNDIRRISRYNGQPAVGLGIKKQRGANAVEVAKAVKEKVEQIRKNLPAGMELQVVFDGTEFIKESTADLTFMLVLSALLTSLVCYLFLASWSSTVNVLLAIPTSIIGSFIFLHFMGFTLNTFTLLGLSLAIGIVVDDAIMVLENIVRHRERGEPLIKAALNGAREITSAATAASIAILAIFIPVVFMKGIVGKFLFQYGVTMSVAVLLSLVEALTLAPMRCSQFLQIGNTSRLSQQMDQWMNQLTRLYRRTLEICLRHRGRVIAGSCGLFLVSLFLATLIRKEFVPPQDQSRFLIRLQAPTGASIGETDKITRLAEAYLKDQPMVKGYYVAIGGFGGGEVNTAMMFVTLLPPGQRPRGGRWRRPTQQNIMEATREALNKIPGIQKAVVQDLSLSGFSSHRGFPVEFMVLGPDWKKLEELSQAIMTQAEASGLMMDVDTDSLHGANEVQVAPDREKAAERGVSMASIGETINALIGGARAGKYTKDGKRYDIRVRLIPEDRQNSSDINNLQVRNNHGELIRLSDVVSVTEEPNLLSISRRNRERAINVSANVSPGKSQQEALKAVTSIAKKVLPEGYRIEFSGSAETFKESFQSLFFALIIGLFVAYMVLASQFNSFIHPFTVLLALPFSVTGAFIALLLGHQSLNIYSMIGLILLMGIVKKNSILLVDFTNKVRERNKTASVYNALLEACPVRLRPILMTSVATIAGALPPALGIGPGAETRIPMALVVIGGVLVSTFLTLFVVPCAYSLLARWERVAPPAED